LSPEVGEVGMKKDYIVELREEEANELMDDHWVGELVRCKDCKYYRATLGYCAYDQIRQENKSHVWGMYCKPDWFCADADRKKGR
jgi:hypothetical protein